MLEQLDTVHDVTIRDMTTDDLERVLQINEANVPEVGPVDLERLRFIVTESTMSVVVVDHAENGDGPDEGVVVGFCVVLAPGSSYDSVNYLWFMDRYNAAYYLDRVAFDASAQGKGLGSALYAEVDRRLAEIGADLTLEVNIDPPNEPSLAFHRKHGFVEVGRHMSKGIEVSLMHKPTK
jgi:predicted GNAT superfamily acetyltransferase